MTQTHMLPSVKKRAREKKGYFDVYPEARLSVCMVKISCLLKYNAGHLRGAC